MQVKRVSISFRQIESLELDISYTQNMRLTFLFLICGLLALPAPAHSWYPRTQTESLLPDGWAGTLVGTNKIFVVGSGDTLIEIARRGRLSYQGLIAANPGVNPWQPEIGQDLVLPFATILPLDLQQGITINLAEFRLYLVWEDAGRIRVRIYPIGLGREGWATPEGDYRVTTIIERPVWTIPAALREENPERSPLMAPGPDNPLGSHWIGLSVDGYGIHGTNRPYGIGRQVSHGCIRLYPRGIIDLVDKIAKGTPVKIIYRPIKVGRQADILYLEAHADYLGRVDDPIKEIESQGAALGWLFSLPDKEKASRVLQEARGVPSRISMIE
ncbi:MAG: L,D-transpeptidase family protein [Deltaproteobacteria bacterium]|jgi:L,D-transpeptidase ErfK/SrfK|nr:L,D-transpeptidase family protein [Deltaproteobacteria bacterium]